MEFYLENLSDKYRKPVIDIFNYFIENSFAAFPEIKVNYDFFDKILNMTRGYPSIIVKDELNNVIGFARNRPFQIDTQFPGCERLGIFTGVQILEPEVLDWIPKGASDSVNEIYPRLISRGRPVKGYFSDSYWCECSTLEGYLTNSLEILKRQGRENLSDQPLPRDCRGVVVGSGVEVPSDTVVTDSVLWKDTRLGARSVFHRVIITEGVEKLPPDVSLRDAVVTPILEEHEVFRTLPTIGDHYALWPIPELESMKP